ncbi:MAG: FAD-binding oxidoreductase, partial [Pseudomonadota bacterium]|nr:FAD-binding oxidoreductase [Pseudomonadota bacterium]
MTDPRIIIVGSGIVGACLAYEASQRGLCPTVVSAGGAAAAGSASAASWAWINACSTDDPSYFRLRYASLQRWQVWMQQLGGIRFTATETFLWDLAPDELRAAVEGLSGLGYPVELIDGVALAARLPRLCEIPEVALHTAVEGAVEPGPTTTALLEASDAEMLTTHVHALLSDGGRISGVMTEIGPVHADEVILAAGNATARLLDTVSVPLQMQSSDGLLVLSDPVGPFLSAVVAGPDFHVRQR